MAHSLIRDMYSIHSCGIHETLYITIQNDKLVLPRSVGKLNKVLEFLNEDVYKGLITESIFRTNSKRRE